MASASVLQPYASAKFDALPEFEEALEAQPLIELAAAAARSLFAAHGLAEACGLAMLHKHFPLGKDEVLVEEPAGEKSLIAPRPASVLETGELLPYMFALEEGEGGAFSLAPLEFAPRAIVNAGNLAALLENTRFINELGSLARSYGVRPPQAQGRQPTPGLPRPSPPPNPPTITHPDSAHTHPPTQTLKGLSFVGVTLLHRDHVAAVDGSTVEFTDHSTRVLTIVPATRAAAYEACAGKHSFTTRTVWTFGSRKGAFNVVALLSVSKFSLLQPHAP